MRTYKLTGKRQAFANDIDADDRRIMNGIISKKEDLDKMVKTFLKRLYALMKGRKISFSNRNWKVSIKDYATAYYSIHPKSILGDGVLLLNPNAIHRKEFMKLRIDKGGELRIKGMVSFFQILIFILAKTLFYRLVMEHMLMRALKFQYVIDV